MTEAEAEICGRLSALEFVLEVLLANELAFHPEEAAAAFKEELLSRDGYIRKGPVDVSDLQAIEAETQKVLKAFVEKVDSREADVRQRINPSIGDKIAGAFREDNDDGPDAA